MDARPWKLTVVGVSRVSLASLAAIFPLTGCALQNTPHKPSAERPIDKQADPPQVVDQTPPAPAVLAQHDQIVAYAENAIQRLDDLHLNSAGSAAAGQPHPPNLAPGPDDGARATPASNPPGADASLPAGSRPSESPPSAANPPTVQRAGDDAQRQPITSVRPPTIVNVSVRADLAPPTAQLGPAAPDATQAPDPASSLAAALGRLLSTGDDKAPADGSFRAQFDRRLLHLLVGEYEQARAPFEAVPQEQAQAAADFIEALIAMREAHGGDLSSEASRVLEHLDRLRAGLIPLSDLALPRMAICRQVTGFGLYEPIDPPYFPGGVASEFVAYCEILHLSNHKLESGEYETRFDVTVTLLTADGRTVQETNLTGVETRWRDARHECFIAPLIRLPGTLSAGDYVAKITVADRIGQKVAQRRATFKVISGG